MSERRHENNIRIPWMHDDFPDGSRILKPNVLPRLARVQRLPYAVAVGDISANAGFARPYVNHVRVGLCHGQTADGWSAVLVENRRPGGRTVGRLPHSPASRAKVVRGRIARNAGHRQRASASKGTDGAVLHPLEKWVALVLVLLRVLGGCRRCAGG